MVQTTQEICFQSPLNSRLHGWMSSVNWLRLWGNTWVLTDVLHGALQWDVATLTFSRPQSECTWLQNYSAGVDVNLSSNEKSSCICGGVIPDCKEMFLQPEYWTASCWNASILLAKGIRHCCCYFECSLNQHTIWIPPSSEKEVTQITVDDEWILTTPATLTRHADECFL